MQLNFSLLTDSSYIGDFDCGEEDLNFYLKNVALLFQRRRFGVTVAFFKATDPKKKIVGYYTLCPASIQRDFIPQKVITGPKPNPIPGFRICRLAIDKNFQGQGLGNILFSHALNKCLIQAEEIGGSVVIIDAKHEKAKKLYERFGFIPTLSDPLVLIQTIKYIQKHFC